MAPSVSDFPDSRPAIEDLKYCLERTDQRQQLLVSLKVALETRLLHPGIVWPLWPDHSDSPQGSHTVPSPEFVVLREEHVIKQGELG